MADNKQEDSDHHGGRGEQVDATSEWWVPNPTCCGFCGSSAAESVDEPLKPCAKCMAVCYCGPDCQVNDLEAHSEHCQALKYMKQDLDEFMVYLYMDSNEDVETAAAIFVEYARLIHPAYVLRVEGNRHFEAQKWKEGAVKYEETMNVLKERKDKIKAMLEDTSLSSESIGHIMVLCEMHAARVLSNLSWCYMIEGFESMADAVPELASWYNASRRKKGAPITNGDSILSMIDCNESDGLRDSLYKLYQKAEDTLRRVPDVGTSWWKIAYRKAQLLQLSLDPHQAMNEIEGGRRAATTPSPLYDPDKESELAQKQLDALSKDVEKVLKVIYPNYSRDSRKRDGKPQGCLGAYFGAGLTPLAPNHPRLPMSAVKKEMLAVRLLAATELVSPVLRVSRDGTPIRPEDSFDPKTESAKLLNEILSTVAQPPLNLFPASGAKERVPPITVHLLAFYFRACLTEKAMQEFGIEEFCEKVTGDWLSDEIAYALATHGFKEVENAHNPRKGHSKTFSQAGVGGCMPCSFRLLRSGNDDWADGLQQAAHFGQVEWIAFCLNRLISGIDGKTVVDAILAPDAYGCNTMFHAANDNYSGFSGLSVRLLAQAASFSVSDFDDKPKAVRQILNTCDQVGFTPAMACISVGNSVGLSAFVALGARLWDKNVNERMNPFQIAAMNEKIGQMGSGHDESMTNAIRALTTRSNEQEPCSYCGEPPKEDVGRLFYCSRCNRSGYCSKECQKSAYKKHKYVCTTAKVEEDVDFYASNISAPTP